MIIQLTDGDIQAIAAVLGGAAVVTAGLMRWATTPTKERLIKVENQVSEIYGFLIKHSD